MLCWYKGKHVFWKLKKWLVDTLTCGLVETLYQLTCISKVIILGICIGLFLQFANYRSIDQLCCESKPIKLDQCCNFHWLFAPFFLKPGKSSPPPTLEDYESQSFITNNESAYSFTAADILLMLPCSFVLKGSSRRSNYLKFSFDFSNWDLAF